MGERVVLRRVEQAFGASPAQRARATRAAACAAPQRTEPDAP
ncbi:hypothetical protein B1M_38061, partial [Burkholderia sp. TJI49]